MRHNKNFRLWHQVSRVVGEILGRLSTAVLPPATFGNRL